MRVRININHKSSTLKKKEKRGVGVGRNRGRLWQGREPPQNRFRKVAGAVDHLFESENCSQIVLKKEYKKKEAGSPAPEKYSKKYSFSFGINKIF